MAAGSMGSSRLASQGATPCAFASLLLRQSRSDPLRYRAVAGVAQG